MTNLITNKYGHIKIDDATIQTYINKTMGEIFPDVKIDNIKLNKIDEDNILSLTIMLKRDDDLAISSLNFIGHDLLNHLHTNLGLSLKCINIGYSNCKRLH